MRFVTDAEPDEGKHLSRAGLMGALEQIDPRPSQIEPERLAPVTSDWSGTETLPPLLG